MPRKPLTESEKKKAMSERLKRSEDMFDELKRKALETPIEEIEKNFPEELFRAMYESFLLMRTGLTFKSKKGVKFQTMEFFLGFLRDKKSLEALAVLKNMGLKRDKEEKKGSKVKWSGKKKK